MSEFPYLIALAFIEQNGKRLMPLGGKSLKTSIPREDDPGCLGESLARDLLLRIFQLSDKGPIQRALGDQSFLLIQISMETMQKEIPLLKAQWIESGANNEAISKLSQLSNRVWTYSFNRDGGAKFLKLK